MFIVPSSCLHYAIMLIQSHAHTQNLNNVLNQNVNKNKNEKGFTISANNLCLLHQNE